MFFETKSATDYEEYSLLSRPAVEIANLAICDP